MTVFLPRLSSVLGGVWLFRIHGRGAAFLRLSRLGCATFLVYVLGLFSFPLGVPKGATSAPCEWPFFASPELGFRWCLAVSHPWPRSCIFAIVQARLRHVFGLRTGALFFSFRGSKGATSAPCEWPFSALPELGFRWCLAVSDPLPRGCRFAFVQARLRHVFGLIFFSFRGSKGATSAPRLSRLGCATFLVRTGALFFSFRGSKGATSAPCEWPFFASPELGFRWCLAVSHPWPRSCIFAIVQARLRHVFGLRTGALFFSFRGSKGATSAPCEWPFSALPELGFRWCLAVSDPLPRGCRFAFVQARLRHVFGLIFFSFRGSKGATSAPRLSRLGCATFLVRTGALFFSFRGSKGATSAPCEWPFFASPELGFRWCLAVSHPWPRSCIFAIVQARLRHVFGLRTGALFFSFRGSKGATSAPCEWLFSALPELGSRWCLAVSDPLPRGCRFAFVQAGLRHVLSTYWGSLLLLWGSKGATSAPCEWPFSALPELGFRWCLAVSDPLPRGCRFAFVQAGLRHVFCLRTGALFFSFKRGSKGATSAPCEWPFFASPELGFRWCLAVSHPWPRSCIFAIVQAIGCATFLVYVLVLFSFP